MNHQATPGLLSLSHYLRRFLGRLVGVGVSNLVTNIPPFARCQNVSPHHEYRCRWLPVSFAFFFFFFLFEGFDQSREQAPSPSPFLSLERLFVFLLTSESSSALAKALFGAARVSLSATLKCYPGDFGGNPPVISPGLTQVQPAVKSLGVWLFPLSPYGRLLLHVHDT